MGCTFLRPYRSGTAYQIYYIARDFFLVNKSNRVRNCAHVSETRLAQMPIFFTRSMRLGESHGHSRCSRGAPKNVAAAFRASLDSPKVVHIWYTTIRMHGWYTFAREFELWGLPGESVSVRLRFFQRPASCGRSPAFYNSGPSTANPSRSFRLRDIPRQPG